MAGSRRRPFRTRGSWIQRVRRSTHRGAKLASNNSDGSPERPVKVLVIGANAGGGADGSPMCVPVFGGDDGIPRSVDKIGEGDVPNMCDGIGEGGASSVPVLKMCNEIGEGGTRSVPIPKMCDGGTRQKEPVKLGPMAVTGAQSTSSILGVVAIASITLASCDVDGRYNCGRAVVASIASNKSEKMTMAANPVIKAALVQAAVDVPMGDVATAANELHLEMVQHLKVMCDDEMICTYAGVHGLV
ncbi:unnamed protein product [Miscanthus lutarioriparius]|uniref:Uncharacterized protein n=1 Tax=Miscanthus lutarioriparius TaxID=422564 RepID=A0A811MZU6_9POAL|nr:unnamed protein product [Miscanthus lutarioriparius]